MPFYLKIFAVLVVLTVLNKCALAVFKQGTDGWTHEIDQDEESGLKIKWKSSPEDSLGNRWLTIEVFARTRGYVGVGFSPHGGMAGGDMAIGWVDSNGNAHLKDYHALANEQPILDQTQDYELLNALESEDGTTIQFRRKWDTCDEHDLTIANDTMRLIWAYSPFDPELSGESVTNLRWHGTQTRGTVSVFMFDDPFAGKFPRDDDPDVKHWDMTMNDNAVEADQTTYFCKILKAPPLTKKHHLIGFKPLLDPKNKKNIHHITFMECVIPPGYGSTEEVFEKYVNHPGGKCYSPNMPPEWAKHCVTFLFLWVAGSEGEMLPDHVGVPLGEEFGGATYFMLELHYDNPELRTFKDNSGVRMYYTDKLRENDGSMVLMGYRVTPFLLLPPKQENFMIHGICSSECTQNAIPEEGINLIITLMHAHLSGRKLRLRHLRNGTELSLPAEDNNYDFNYQQSRTLKNEVKILRGDELIVECEYETTDNNRIVLGGLSTRQEMCQAFLMYYPRIDFMQCTSQYEFHDFFKGLSIDEVSGDVLKAMKMPFDPNALTPAEKIFDTPDDARELEESGDGASYRSVFDHIRIESPNQLKNMSVGDYLKRVNWSDKEFIKQVESEWKNGRHYPFCTGHGRKRIPMKVKLISPDLDGQLWRFYNDDENGEMVDKFLNFFRQNHIIPYPEIKETFKKPISKTCSFLNKQEHKDESIIHYTEVTREKKVRLKEDNPVSAGSSVVSYSNSFTSAVILIAVLHYF